MILGYFTFIYFPTIQVSSKAHQILHQLHPPTNPQGVGTHSCTLLSSLWGEGNAFQQLKLFTTVPIYQFSFHLLPITAGWLTVVWIQANPKLLHMPTSCTLYIAAHASMLCRNLCFRNSLLRLYHYNLFNATQDGRSFFSLSILPCLLRQQRDYVTMTDHDPSNFLLFLTAGGQFLLILCLINHGSITLYLLSQGKEN